MADFKVTGDKTDEYVQSITTENCTNSKYILLQLELYYYDGPSEDKLIPYIEGACLSNTVHKVSTDASLKDIMQLIENKKIDSNPNLRVVVATQWFKQFDVDFYDAQDIDWLSSANNHLHFKNNELSEGNIYLCYIPSIVYLQYI